MSMSIVSVSYIAVGFLSFLAWPDVERGSITAQLAEDKPDQLLLILSSWMVIVAVILT